MFLVNHGLPKGVVAYCLGLPGLPGVYCSCTWQEPRLEEALRRANEGLLGPVGSLPRLGLGSVSVRYA